MLINTVTPSELLKVQTFDFQNDWALDWTNYSIWAWDCSIVSWQWWQITRSASAMQWWVKAPNSILVWELKKIKIRWYKSWNWCFGIQWCAADKAIEYGRETTQLNVPDGTVANITLNWEITMELTFEDNWHITAVLWNNWNSYTYDLWAYASQFQWYWTNADFWIRLWRWNNNNPVYVRKIEITTVG